MALGCWWSGDAAALASGEEATSAEGLYGDSPRLDDVGLEDGAGLLAFLGRGLEEAEPFCCCCCCWRHLARRFLNHT